MSAVYKRILLKLSGEVLAGKQGHGIDFETVQETCKWVNECAKLGVQIGLVVGGGNFWRGRSSGDMDRTRADHIGMLATAMNSLALADALEQYGLEVRVQTAIEMRQVAEPYIRNKAIRHMEKGRVVIFGCGTGNPFFSTDTAAALRAAEIDADIIFKAPMWTAFMTKTPTNLQTRRSTTRFRIPRCFLRGLRLWTQQRLLSAATTIFRFWCSTFPTPKTLSVRQRAKISAQS